MDKECITLKKLQNAITDLYLHVKIRNSEEIANFTEEKYQEEKTRLTNTDPFTIIEYIRASVEIIMNLKSEELEQSRHAKGESMTQKSEMSSMEPPRDYEAMVQKLEAEVRNHIRVEQQLKLHIETMQFKMEELERNSKKSSCRARQLSEEIKSLQEQIKRKDKDIEKLNKELTSEKEKGEELRVELENAKKGLELPRSHKKLEESFNHEETAGNIRINFLETKKKSNATGDTNKLNQIPNLKHSNIMASKGTRSVPNLHKLYNKSKKKHKSKQKEGEEQKLEESNRIINAPKGIGINEQNIYQIICKTSDNPHKDYTQYLTDFYKGKLDEKTREVSKLRNQLRSLKAQLKGKCEKNQCRKARSASFGISLNASNFRSKSQKKLGAESQRTKAAIDLLAQPAMTDPRRMSRLKNKMDVITSIIAKRTTAANLSSKNDHSCLGTSRAKASNDKSRKHSLVGHRHKSTSHKGYIFPPSTTFAHLIDSTIETALFKRASKKQV